MKRRMKMRIILKDVFSFLISFFKGEILKFLADQAIAKIKAISLYMKDFNKIIVNCQKEIGSLPKKN